MSRDIEKMFCFQYGQVCIGFSSSWGKCFTKNLKDIYLFATQKDK